MILRSVLLFTLTGVAEIGGGYLIWLWLREGRPVWVSLAGALVVVLHGIIPTFQPPGLDFGKVYAAYAGAFIALLLLSGWVVDGVVYWQVRRTDSSSFQYMSLPCAAHPNSALLVMVSV